jgi:hypothetical protein
MRKGVCDVTADEIVTALRQRHGKAGVEWAFFAELRAGTGYRSVKQIARTGINPEQRFDAWAINLYPSKKFHRIAYEIKVSRSDFIHEIETPKKRHQALLYSNEFYFVTPKGLVDKSEIPDECGLIEVWENGGERITNKYLSKIVVKAPLRTDESVDWTYLMASIARRGAVAEGALLDANKTEKEAVI